jgi:molecular chaperone GrpE
MTTGRNDKPEGPAEEQREAAETDAAAAVDADLDALADVQRERDEYLELAQRARADFENFRKRAAGQAADAERRGKAGIARELVPVIDNLERALEAAPADDPLRKGVELVHADLAAVLERGGVEAYDPAGEPFDPSFHEALTKQAVEGAEPGTVIETVERGYRLDGHVIRPARVVVAE